MRRHAHASLTHQADRLDLELSTELAPLLRASSFLEHPYLSVHEAGSRPFFDNLIDTSISSLLVELDTSHMR